MSPLFWMTGAGVMLGSVTLGAGLGGYAAGRWEGGLWSRDFEQTLALEVGNPDAAYPDYRAAARADGPTEPIVCRGCGPTLAERQMQAEMEDAYATGERDPALRAYEDDATRWETAETSPEPVKPAMPPATAPAALAVVAPAIVTPGLVLPAQAPPKPQAVQQD